MDSNDRALEARARELLAAEYAKDERYGMAHAAWNGSRDVMPAIRAITAALSQQPGVQEGWVLVPRWKVERAARIVEDDGDEHGVGHDMREWLAAAPQPGKEG